MMISFPRARLSSTLLLIVSLLFLGSVVVRGDSNEDVIEPDDYVSDDHWNYSTHLNEKNFNSFITRHIQAGKTVFVRWTAGLYCGSCAKQAQAWDDAIRLFANNPAVVFGDVNIKEKGITSLKLPPHKPGHDGWPTIRYFNSNTGLEGGDYVAKTKMRKWEELGPEHMFLIEYIEDMSNSPLCDVITTKNCDNRSYAFIQNANKLTPIELQAKLEEVHVKENEMRHKKGGKRDLWLIQQKSILLQLVGNQIFR